MLGHVGQESAACALRGVAVEHRRDPRRTRGCSIVNSRRDAVEGIDHEVKLISQKMIEPIQHTKVSMLHGSNPRLHTDEVLVTLSILSLLDDNCRRALDSLPLLDGCQMHTTVMTSDVDRKIFKKLGIGFTSEPIRKD